MIRRRAALALLMSVGTAVPLAAQDTEWNRYTLEGLEGVFVRTEATEACEALGVTASSVQADAAVLLLEAEVPLLTQEEMLANVALPRLRVTLECQVGNGGSDVVAYSVALRVQQAAKMIRDEQITLAEAVTWFTSHVGVASAETVSDSIQDALAAKLEEFAEAYAAANAEDVGTG